MAEQTHDDEMQGGEQLYDDEISPELAAHLQAQAAARNRSDVGDFSW